MTDITQKLPGELARNYKAPATGTTEKPAAAKVSRTEAPVTGQTVAQSNDSPPLTGGKGPGCCF